MKIELKKVTVKDLCKGYENCEEEGVRGYNGFLDIRPPYQREFVYEGKEREEVIHTVLKGFPLNIMYWVDKGNSHYEVLDGQQRTMSLCEYVQGRYSIQTSNGICSFSNLSQDLRVKIENYELTIYVCTGDESEKLEWFKVVNIAGRALNKQELLNAVYQGTWILDARRDFSRTGCRAQGLGDRYLKGSPINQDYLETVLKWVSKNNIERYMAEHQRDTTAEPLWEYFRSVIKWIDLTFYNYRKEMKGLDWGFLYNQFKETPLDAEALEIEITNLMEDEDVSNKKGIYSYVLTRDERCLNIRSFNPRQKREVFESQKGVCVYCSKKCAIEEMEADHITPWHEGGRTNKENCQMLCKGCNRRKAGK